MSKTLIIVEGFFFSILSQLSWNAFFAVKISTSSQPGSSKNIALVKVISLELISSLSLFIKINTAAVIINKENNNI
jgi:hypothetical protein